MTFEEFKIIHTEIANAIKGSKYEDIAFYTNGCVRNIYLAKNVPHINICISLKNGAKEFADFLATKLGIYSEDTKYANPINFPSIGKSELMLPSIEDKTPPCYITIKEPSKTIVSETQKFEYGTMLEDAYSKDFTVNALYCKISSRLVFDAIGNAKKDLDEKILRCCSDPTKTFSDSPIRILRAVRIASELGFAIPSDTWVGMCKNVRKLYFTNKLEIQRELNKIFLIDKPSDAIRKLYHCGALEIIMPEVCWLKNIKQGVSHYEDAFDHSLTVMDKTQPILEHRIAGLLHDLGKQTALETNLFGDIKFTNHEDLSIDLAEMLLEDLKYDEVTINKVSMAIKNHTRFKRVYNPSNHSIKKFIEEVELENVDVCLDVIEANNTSHTPKYCIEGQTEMIKRRIKSIIEKKSDPKKDVKLPINGNDIMVKFKIKKGPLIGKCLEGLKEYMLVNPKMTKEEAFEIISKDFIPF